MSVPAAMAANWSQRQSPANRKRPVESPEPVSCIICTEPFTGRDDPKLIKPCPMCENDYCVHCVEDMFHSALADNERMPARCCVPIQLYIVVSRIPEAPADQYRAKFTEWLLPDKVYCPVPTCSTFINENHIPFDPRPATYSFEEVLQQILDKVWASPSSRFFRTGDPQSGLPRFKEIISNPVDLKAIGDRVNAAEYKTAEDFMAEFRLLVANAEQYNSPSHPVTDAARKVEEIAQTELNFLKHHLAKHSDESDAQQTTFACPSCQIAICANCHKVGHEGVCDRTTENWEQAMLQSFNYKRCPRCRHGVKKMFGCPHINCVCGAHFCYHCLRSMDECPGGCGPDTDVEEDERAMHEEEDSEQEEENESQEARDRQDSVGELSPPSASAQDQMNEIMQAGPNSANTQPRPATTAAAPPTLQHATFVSLQDIAPGVVIASMQPLGRRNAVFTHMPTRRAVPERDNSSQAPVNLDAGGARVWADRDLNFGDEPEEERFQQIWSCHHNFNPFQPREGSCNRGDLSRMECNRCWAHVHVKGVQVGHRASKRRKSKDSSNNTIETKVALECRMCSLIVCGVCKERYDVEEERRRRKQT